MFTYCLLGLLANTLFPLGDSTCACFVLLRLVAWFADCLVWYTVFALCLADSCCFTFVSCVFAFYFWTFGSRFYLFWVLLWMLL